MNKESRSIITMESQNNNAGRWFWPVRLFFVLLIVLLTAAYAVQFSYAEDKETVNLYFDVSFESNLLLNKYDVSLELDGKQVDTIKYDTYYTKLCAVTPGNHVIRVCKEDDPDVIGEKTIAVKEDTTFQFKLKTKRKEIEFVEQKKIKGTAGHSIEMPDCVGFHLVDARKALEKKGYVNTRYEGGKEETIDENRWAVDVQNVKAGAKIDKNDEIILTCIPVEEYINKTFPGMTYGDAIKKAEAIGYKNIEKIDDRSDGSVQEELDEVFITKKAKKYWTVKSAEDEYDERKIILNFVYNVPMPDLTGKKATKAESKMEAINQDHFEYEFVGYKSGDYIDRDDLKKYKIVEQSEKPGNIIKYQSTIIFKCKKTKAAKAAEAKAKAAAAAAAEREKQEELERKMNMKVWYTNTGDCYHTESCWHLRSKNGPITQREAIARNMEPCSDCIARSMIP